MTENKKMVRQVREHNLHMIIVAYREKLHNAIETESVEDAHKKADKLILELLKTIGNDFSIEGIKPFVKEYETMEKWYGYENPNEVPIIEDI